MAFPIAGTDTASDPGITNNVETTPKKTKVRAFCTKLTDLLYLNFFVNMFILARMVDTTKCIIFVAVLFVMLPMVDLVYHTIFVNILVRYCN